MDILKKLWPIPFKITEKDVTSFVVQLVIFILVCAVPGVLIGILSLVPIVRILVGIVGRLVELYGLIGIILCILVFLGVIK